MSLVLLDIDDLDPARLASVIDLAIRWKRDPTSVPQVLAGRGAALVFEKPSARTRASTEMAVATLGGHPIYIRGDEVGFDTRESVEDVARTLASYAALIAARTFAHSTLERIAESVDVPVVNLLSDAAHPVQALADVLTLREQWGELEGRKLAFVGDGNNMAASLALACAFSGMEFSIATPVGYEIPDVVVERVRNMGGEVEVMVDPYDAVRGADAVYTDVWTSMGQEGEREQRIAAFAGYTVDEPLMAAANLEARFLHCLPAHRGEEVSAEVLEGPASVIWPQAENRMHSIRALFALLLDPTIGSF